MTFPQYYYCILSCKCHICVKQFYDERLHEKNICKKHLFVFWFLVKDFIFQDKFYKIQNIN